MTDDPPNLLVFCVDCLRSDFCYREQVATPFLDGLRERGLDCTEMYATATTTTPCVASLLSGCYGERNGVLSLRRGTLSPDVPTLGDAFGDAGYHTEAFLTGPLVEETKVGRDFEVTHYREESADLFGDWRETLRGRLADLPEPFVAFVHLWELHEDVHVPADYDAPEYGETAYGRALSALDRELEAAVEAAPDRTRVAVTGDHGESVTHRKNPLRLLAKSLRDALQYYGGVDLRDPVRAVNRRLRDVGPDVADHFLENGHGENVYDFTTNVPFVLAGPGVEAATVEAQVRQIDVLPTLLDVHGLPEADTDGEAIDASAADRPAYMRACGASLHRERNWARAVRAGDAKLVTYPGLGWAPDLYDLRAHPLELDTVEDSALADRLEAHFPEGDGGPGDAERLDIDERLARLGYK